MNKLVSVSTVVLSLLFLMEAKAGQPGPDWMPAQQVIEQALRSGYTQVSELEADDGRWESEGLKNGQKTGVSCRSQDRRHHLRKARRLREQRGMLVLLRNPAAPPCEEVKPAFCMPATPHVIANPCPLSSCP